VIERCRLPRSVGAARPFKRRHRLARADRVKAA
jgi:hypothetical protein